MPVIKHKPQLAYTDTNTHSHTPHTHTKVTKTQIFIALTILYFATFHGLEVIFRYCVCPCVGKPSQNCILRHHTGNLKSVFGECLCYDIQLTLQIKAFSPLESQLLYTASAALKKSFLSHKNNASSISLITGPGQIQAQTQLCMSLQRRQMNNQRAR